MNDQPQTIPAGLTPEEAKKAREWALHALNKPGASTTAEKAVARVVIGTVPEPRPTLADMTMPERLACKWMQADVEGGEDSAVIVNPYWEEGSARALWPGGFMEQIEWERVTPRRDLPRLEWPDAADAVPESTLAVGSVWHNMDALTRACEETGRDQIVVLDRAGDAHIWSGAVEQWEVMAPLSVNGPFTILHDGKKADQ